MDVDTPLQLGRSSTGRRPTYSLSLLLLLPLFLGLLSINTTEAKYNASTIMCGAWSTCIMQTEGTGFCWGKGDDGRLGRNPSGHFGRNPGEMTGIVPIVFGTTHRLVKLVPGSHTCAIFENGRIRCLGDSAYGEPGYLTAVGFGISIGAPGSEVTAVPFVDFSTTHPAVDVYPSVQHTCALFSNGKLRCWGEGASGKLGYNNVSNKGGSVSTSTIGWLTWQTTHRVVMMDTGQTHNCAVFTNGGIRCWGNGSNGRTGRDNTQTSGGSAATSLSTIAFITFSTTHLALSVSLQRQGSCALFNNYKIRCWGVNNQGSLGNGASTNIGNANGEMSQIDFLPLATLTKYVSCGELTCCTLDFNNDIYCWGSASYGSLGKPGGTSNHIGNAPGEVAAVTPINFGHTKPVRHLCDSDHWAGHYCAVFGSNDTTQQIQCWGINDVGQLGIGNLNWQGDQFTEMTALPMVPLSTCGDGQTLPHEPCDDGNTIDGDGCNADCELETGWTCAGSPSVCSSSCPDGIVDAGEQCDDNNAAVGDGCHNCLIEPEWICPTGGCVRTPSTLPPITQDIYMREGGVISFPMRLNTFVANPNDVQISITVGGPTTTWGPNAFQWDTTDWGTTKTMTFNVPQDTIVGPSVELRWSVTFTYGASTDSRYAAIPDHTYKIWQADDDLKITDSGSGTSISEGGAYTAGLTLSHQPVYSSVSSVTVSIDQWNTLAGEFSISPNILTFTYANWNISQNVVFTHLHPDTTVGAGSVNHIVPMYTTSDDPGWDANNRTLFITVDESDYAIVGAPTQIILDEGGSTQFSIKLNGQNTPAAVDVVLSVSTAITGVTVSPATLTYNATNWMVDQVVTVTSIDDASVNPTLVTGPVAISHAKYGNVNIVVTVKDDEYNITTSPCCAEVVLLDGESVSYSVTLSVDPISTVAITPSLPAYMTAVPATITLTPGTKVATFTITDANAAGTGHAALTGSIGATLTSTDPRLFQPSVSSTPVRVLNLAAEGAVIDTVVPLAGLVAGGDAVTITGERMGSSTADVSVTLAGVPAVVNSWAPHATDPTKTVIVVQSSAAPGLADTSGPIAVTTTVSGRALTSRFPGPWQYTGGATPTPSPTPVPSTSPAPINTGAAPSIKITSFNPAMMSVGAITIVTLTSPAFNGLTSKSNIASVTVAGVNCTDSFQLVSGSSGDATCVVEPTPTISAGMSGFVIVSLMNGTQASSDPAVFTFTAASGTPSAGNATRAIAAFSPTSLSQQGGETLIILGKGFGTYARDIKNITVAGVLCSPVTYISESRVMCTTQPGSAGINGSVIIIPRVGDPVVSVLSARYAYDGPKVLDTRPTMVKPEGGTELTIRGAGFTPVPGDPIGTITVGGVPCTHPNGVFISDTLLRCLAPPQVAVPNSAGPVPVAVTVSGLTSTGQGIVFAYGIECDPPCGWDAQCANSADGTASCTCDEGWYLPPECILRDIVLTRPNTTSTSEQGATAMFHVSLSHPPTTDVTVTMSVSDALEATVVPTFVALTSDNWAQRQQVLVSGLADGVHDGAKPYTVTFSVNTADADFARAGANLVPFRFVNLDLPPVVHKVKPTICPLAGCNVTVEAHNLAHDVAAYLGQDYSLNVRRAPTLVAPVSPVTSAAPTLLQAAAQAGLEAHVLQTQELLFETKPATEGYHKLSLVNPTGVEANFDMYFTDECPTEGMWGRGADCKPCPVGGHCPGGYRIIAQPGYWNLGEESGFVQRCDPPDRCLGQPVPGEPVVCAPKYTGSLCSECIADYYKTVNGECVECPKGSDKLPFIIADACLWTLVAIAHLAITDNMTLSYLIMAVRTLQMVAGLGELGDSNLPGYIKGIYSFLHLFSGDYDFLKPDCFNPTPYHTKFWLKFAYSIGIFVPTWLLLSVAWVVVSLYRSSTGTTDQEPTPDNPRAGPWYFDRLCRSVLIWVGVMYFTTTATAIETLSCFRIDGVYVMITEPSVKCYSVAGQQEVTAMSVILLLIFTIGFPLGFALFLRKNKDRMLQHRFLNKYSFLYEFYKPGFTAFWTIEFMIVTIVAASNSALVPHPKYQFSLCTIVFTSKATFILWKKPFLDAISNTLHLVMSIAYLIGLNVSLLSKVINVDTTAVNGPVSIAMVSFIGLSIVAMIVLMVIRLVSGPTADSDVWAATDTMGMDNNKANDFDMDSLQSPYDPHGKPLMWIVHENDDILLEELASIGTTVEDEDEGILRRMSSASALLPWKWFADSDSGDHDDNDDDDLEDIDIQVNNSTHLENDERLPTEVSSDLNNSVDGGLPGVVRVPSMLSDEIEVDDVEVAFDRRTSSFESGYNVDSIDAAENAVAIPVDGLPSLDADGHM